MTRFQLFLAIVFVSTWTWAAHDPADAQIWFVENILVLIAVPLILLIGYYVRFSRISWSCLTIFFTLHLIGSHYTYAEVPFGFTLQELFSSNRNMYDRLVHFSFGLLMYYPVREVILAVSSRRTGLWGLYLPVEVIIAMSAVYELLEWIAVMDADTHIVNGILGSQGDIWDAQKDISAAIIGALFTSTCVALIHWKYNPDFWNELRYSISLVSRKRGNADEHLLRRIQRGWRRYRHNRTSIQK